MLLTFFGIILVAPELQDFHVKLLRKLKRSVNPEKWEKSIVKFCYSYGGSDDAFEVERYGYLHSSSAVKLRILKNLLEGQFDVNAKFKNLINAKPSNEMRHEPFGKDKEGNVYYCQVDEKANIRIYQENQDEESWSVVAANREELVKLIEDLKGHRPIRPSKDLIDEDSSSNSRQSDPNEKIEEKKEVSNEQEYKIDNLNASEDFPLKQTIRLIKKTEIVTEDCDEAEIEQKDETETTSQARITPKKRKRK